LSSLDKKKYIIYSKQNYSEKLKKIFKMLKKALALIVIIIILFSPYLLVVDFKRYAPFVAFVWILSVVYYIFIRKRE
jgi:hypothetical protein